MWGWSDQTAVLAAAETQAQEEPERPRLRGVGPSVSERGESWDTGQGALGEEQDSGWQGSAFCLQLCARWRWGSDT